MRKKLLAVVLTLVLVLSLVPQVSFAEVGQTPAHTKTVNPNGDGTYKIELTVTGDADTDVETTADVNVIVVYDTSNSMTSNYANGTSGPTRADAAEKIISDFAGTLFGYQDTSVADPQNIQMGLIIFNHDASRIVDWNNSTSLSYIQGRLGDGSAGSAHSSYYNSGTNWESAMLEAEAMLGELRDSGDDDPTFVIFITDGLPSQKADTPAGTYYNIDEGEAAQVLECAQAAMPVAGRIESDDTTLYGIYAYGNDLDYLDDVIYFAKTGEHRASETTTIVDNDGVVDDYYFNAYQTSALEQAINQISESIVAALGVSQVAISDGTTSNVQAGSEVVDLVEVIDGSYQYWMAIPVDSNNQFTLISDSGENVGETVTYTVSDDGKTITWDGGSETVNGEFVTIDGKKNIKYEWTGPNGFYDKTPPTAALNSEGNAVDWAFSKDFGALLDGVTYSVSFDVTPTQTTLDYIADIKNGKYDDLPEEVKQYINEDGEFDTNTEATISWVDTRPGGGEGSDTFTPPEAQEADAVKMLTVTKKWVNEIDTREQPPVTLDVTRDGEKVYEVTLSDANNWEKEVYISIGIMKTKGLTEPEILATGHDFSFEEEPGESGVTFYWQLNVPTVHPMMIDGVTTMLVKEDAKHPVPEGATTYELDGATYYVDEEVVALTALNERRSRLFFTKEVEGEDVPEDAVFNFTFNVVNPLAPEKAPTEEEDPNHDSDWWIWFSAREADGTRITEGVTGAESAGDGWWYAPSGEDVTIPAHAGCSILVNNLPSGTTYTITEEMDMTFVFTSSELETDGAGTDPSFVGEEETTGTIDETNTEYYVTFTNTYEVIDVTVDKVWDDGSNGNNTRPETLELTLDGYPEGVEVPEPTIEKSEDGNTWTYTWSKLPKYELSGDEIKYTVTEYEIPDGYSCEETTVENGGTITNKLEAVWGDPPVQKILDGDKPAKDSTFTFTLTPVSYEGEGEVEKLPMPDEESFNAQKKTVEITGEGTEEFGEFPFTVPGTYTYTITEEKGEEEGYEYDDTVHTIVYKVTKNEQTGKLECEKSVDGTVIDGDETDEANVSKFSFTNTYTKPTVEVTVVKVWDDGDNAQETRPTVVTIALKAGGKDTGKTVKLSEDNDWTDVFADLDKYDENGEEIEYTVEEQNVPTDYTATVSGDAENGFQVTNKLNPPDTGDHSDIALWSATMAVSMLGLVLLALIKRRKPAKRSR